MSEKDFIRVDEWTPKEEDMIIRKDGKLIYIPFDEIFNKPSLKDLNKFIISKDSYVNELDGIIRYLNYFIKFYDTDNELLVYYLRIRFLLSENKNSFSIKSFNRLIEESLLTKSIRNKIKKMVDDNYYIDLSSKKKNAKYSESLEFTNDHAKTLHEISIAMRIIIPVVFHFFNLKNINKDHIYKIYHPLFDLFDENVLINKLEFIIINRIKTNHSKNYTIWNQREIFGVSELTQAVDLLNGKLISDTMFKFIFSKNIISFIYSILDRQLGFFISETYKENRIEVTDKKEHIEGLSGLDKLEMNLVKIDESSIILSEVVIDSTIKKIKRKMNIEIDKEELDFYLDNMKIEKFTSQLVFYFYAKYFGGYRDLYSLSKIRYTELILLLKKRLQYHGYIYLPQILTANIEGKLNTRTIRNNKFLTKVESSDIYQRLIKDKYSTLEDVGKSSLILNLLSTILNTPFSFVDYKHPDKLGVLIEIEQDKVSDEFLHFINEI